MGSYWKSMAAQVLPSWLKNLRAGRHGLRGTEPVRSPRHQPPILAMATWSKPPISCRTLPERLELHRARNVAARARAKKQPHDGTRKRLVASGCRRRPVAARDAVRLCASAPRAAVPGRTRRPEAGYPGRVIDERS